MSPEELIFTCETLVNIFFIIRLGFCLFIMVARPWACSAIFHGIGWPSDSKVTENYGESVYLECFS